MNCNLTDSVSFANGIAQVHLSESRDEEDCINIMQQILDLLQSPGFDPAKLAPYQLTQLCVDIQQLVLVGGRLAASPLDDDKKLAESIHTYFADTQFGANSLASAAAAYSPSDPNIGPMRDVFVQITQDGSFPTLKTILQNLIQHPFDPPLSEKFC